MKPASIALLNLFIASALYMGRAEATCTIGADTGLTTISSQLVVDSDLPAGSVIRTFQSGFGEGSPAISCTEDHTVLVDSKLQDHKGVSIAGDIRELYTSSGQPTGVGLRFKFTDADTVQSDVPYDRTITFRATSGAVLWRSGVRGEYVKLRDNVEYGPVETAETRLARSLISDRRAFPNGLLRRVVIGNITLIRPTCAIDVGSLNQQVDLGQHSVSDFDNQQATGWMDFSLTMSNCVNPIETIADITFGQLGDADAANPGLFSMNQGGPDGLGIAIRVANQNLAMAPGETRQFGVLQTGQSYDFQARLERTVGEVTPGAVDRSVAVRVTFR